MLATTFAIAVCVSTLSYIGLSKFVLNAMVTKGSLSCAVANFRCARSSVYVARRMRLVEYDASCVQLRLVVDAAFPCTSCSRFAGLSCRHHDFPTCRSRERQPPATASQRHDSEEEVGRPAEDGARPRAESRLYNSLQRTQERCLLESLEAPHARHAPLLSRLTHE